MHPPLQYILNKVFYDSLNDWSLVRVISSLLFCFASIFYVERKRIELETPNVINDFILIFITLLNPIYLLWGTSLRWYAYYVPLLLVLLAVKKSKKTFFQWFLFTLGLLILSYIGYAGLFLLPSLLLFFWAKDISVVKSKLIHAIICISAFVLLYYYQFTILVTHQLTHKADQSFSIKQSVIAFVSSHMSNQGIFPISFFGLLSIAGFSILYLWNFLTYVKTKKMNVDILAYLIGIIVFIITGIAGKMRNFIVLSPLQNALFGWSKNNPYKNIFLVAIVMIFLPICMECTM